jgi:hypothetical protein
MPLLNGVPLPHEGRARYPLADSRMVLIDLDDKHVVIEVHKDHLAELPGLDKTFAIKAGDLCFLYYLKTPDMMEFLKSKHVEIKGSAPANEHEDTPTRSKSAFGPLGIAESTSMGGPEQIEKIVKNVTETGYLPDGSRKCLLCSDTCPNEAMFVGVFIANQEHQTRIGYSKKKLAKGGRRLIVYQLCPTCFERPSRNEDVETKIMSEVSVQ